MKYELRSNNVLVNTFETAQEAMDWGEAYYKDGYSVISK